LVAKCTSIVQGQTVIHIWFLGIDCLLTETFQIVSVWKAENAEVHC